MHAIGIYGGRTPARQEQTIGVFVTGGAERKFLHTRIVLIIDIHQIFLTGFSRLPRRAACLGKAEESGEECLQE